MPVTMKITGENAHAFIIGEIDHHLAKALREEIDNAVISSGATGLVLDFGSVSFMDSSGIGLIMGRYKLMQEIGGSLLVCSIPKNLKKVMQISGLEKLGIIENGGQNNEKQKKH